MRKQIEDKLSHIVGLPLNNIGRASNMIWMNFGNQRVVLNRSGNKKTVGEYSLHVQCSWRFTHDNKVILASKDIYTPCSNWNHSEHDFDLGQIGSSRFDERVVGLFDELLPITILYSDVDQFGGIKINFSSNISFDVFPDYSDEVELWRLFQPGDTSQHFVVTSKGIEI